MDIHKFEVNGEYILLDVNSGSVHVLDHAAYRMLDVFNGVNDAAVLNEFAPEFGAETVRETLEELHELIDAGMLFSPVVEIPPVFSAAPIVKSLCLHIAHDCNLRCGYCFAGTGAFGHERGLMTPEVACRAIDFNTIVLLLGMMIIVANLRLGGFFQLANEWIIKRARYPMMLLAAIVLVSGTLSAFLVNDTICLALTPLVLELVTRLKRNPIPYLLAIAMASNVGSVATITGNRPLSIMRKLSPMVR